MLNLSNMFRAELAGLQRHLAREEANKAAEAAEREKAANARRDRKQSQRGVAAVAKAKANGAKNREMVAAALEAAGTAWISDIARETGLHTETVSQHLAALEKAGKAHREGKAFPYHWVVKTD